MSFSHLGLSEKVVSAVATAGYKTPTPIQQQAIPHVLARRDVLGIAQTGTGKTAAFTLPMLTMLEGGRARARMPRTLILEPTRELAAQVEESFVKYGSQHKLNVALLIGGVSFGDQETKIMRGVDVLIATPGRMLDMGFIPDIEKICKLVPFTRQTLFFSATMPPEITRLTEQFLHNPARVEVARAASTVETTSQTLVPSGGSPHDKRATLRRIVRGAENFKNAIIFCNRKRDVQVVHRSLERHGFSVGVLHGDLDQRARMAALDAFRAGQVQLLVCSDVAARGLDIPDVSHIINYDAPHHAEDYVHRIGRTGRAGKAGVAVTIVTPADQKSVAAIEKLIARKVEWQDGAALPPDDEAEQPARERRSRRADRGERARAEGAEREERPDRHSERAPESRHHHAPRPQREKAAAEQERAQRPHRYGETPRERPRREDNDRVVGLGDHVPSFLLRPVPTRRHRAPEAEAVAED